MRGVTYDCTPPIGSTNSRKSLTVGSMPRGVFKFTVFPVGTSPSLNVSPWETAYTITVFQLLFCTAIVTFSGSG